jgi:hypothetical protein
MPSNKWFSLSDSNKAICDPLDDQAKGIILGYVPPTNTTSSSRPSFPKPPLSRPFTGKSSFAKASPGTQSHLHEIFAYDFLLANMHSLESSDNIEANPNNKPVDPRPEDDPSNTRLINAAKPKSKPIPPGDICRVMSKSSTRHVNIAKTQYHVSFHDSLTAKNLLLIDQRANGGVAGEDVRVIFLTDRTVDIKGIDNHHVNDIGIGTVGGVVNTQKGPVIATMHQYALLGKGASFHSPSQLEWYKNDVNDKLVHVPSGLQRLTTLDGYVIPLTIKDGLARLDIWPHTDHEYKTLPHAFLTSKVEWDPTVLDHEFTDESQWGEDNPLVGWMLTSLRILLINTRGCQQAPPYIVPSLPLTPRLMLFVKMKQSLVTLFIQMSLQLMMIPLLLSSLLVQTLILPVCTV